MLADACDEFLEEIRQQRTRKTLAQYTTALEYFQASCPRINVHSVESRRERTQTCFPQSGHTSEGRPEIVNERLMLRCVSDGRVVTAEFDRGQATTGQREVQLSYPIDS